MNTFAISRVFGYIICCTVAVLFVGTLSTRLIEANAAWLYLAIGGGIGLLSAALKPILAVALGFSTTTPPAVYATLSFVFAVALLLVFRRLDGGWSISLGGVFLGAGLAASGSTFMYCLFDMHDE